MKVVNKVVLCILMIVLFSSTVLGFFRIPAPPPLSSNATQYWTLSNGELVPATSVNVSLPLDLDVGGWINITQCLRFSDGTIQCTGINKTNVTVLNAGGEYLYNDTMYIYFNESKMNKTVQKLNTQWTLNTTVFVNNTGTLSIVKSWWQGFIRMFSKKGDGNYLTNDSTTIYFNEAKMNDTIDARDTDTDTHIGSDGNYLTDDYTTMYFNETKLNATIDSKNSATTIWQTDGTNVTLISTPANVTIDGDLNVTGSIYTSNNSVYIGDVKMSNVNGELNISNVVRSPYFEGDGSRLSNISFNASTGDFTFNGNIILNNHNITNVTCIYFTDGSMQCKAPIWEEQFINGERQAYFNGSINVTGDAWVNGDIFMNKSTLYFVDPVDRSIGLLSRGGYGHSNNTLLWNGEPIIVGWGIWDINNSKYMINNSATLDVNETTLNATIDAREIDTHIIAVGPQLIDNRTHIWVNDSFFNISINFTDTNTQWPLNTTTLINNSGTLSVNVSWLQGMFLQVKNFFTKDTNSPYLYNDSTTIYFNETKLNSTISSLDTDTHVAGDNVYLTNDSTTMYFDESKMNSTISALDTDTHAAGDGKYLFNDSTTIYVNETKLNSTILILSDVNDNDTHVSGDGNYLTNDSTTMYFNESKMNATIILIGEQYDNDTLYTAGVGLILNNEEFSTNNTYFDSKYYNRSLADITFFRNDGGVINGSVTINGDFTIIGSYVNATVANQFLNGSFIPALNNTFDIGSSSLPWKTIYAGTLNGNLDCSYITGSISNLCTIVDTDTHIGSDGNYLTDNGITMYFNETKLNATISALDIDTHVTGDSNYLTNDTTTMYFNETKMNNTIITISEQYDTDTHVAGDNNYLTNDSITMYFNETKLNKTITALDTDTNTQWVINETVLRNQSGVLGVNKSWFQSIFLEIANFFTKDTDSPYLYNNSNTIYFNETKLNTTIISITDERDTDTHVEGDNLYLTNDSTTMYFNESRMNNTISTLDTDTRVEGIDYLYNDSTYMYLNETKLNNTINALDVDTDTHVAGDQVYLTNDSTTMYFNETKLNNTISTLDTDTDTWWPIIDYIINDSGSININETQLNNTIITITDDRDTDTHVSGDNLYLTNDSTTMFFNETKLNNTITALDTNTQWVINETVLRNQSGVLGVNKSWFQSIFLEIANFFTKGTDSPYLYNDSNIIYFNETKLNNTISTLDTDTDTHVGGDNNFLTNDSTTMYFNETKLNNTISALDTDTDTHVSGDNLYLTNDSTTMFFNETRLNNTIIVISNLYDNNTDTRVVGIGYLYNDSTYMYLNETLLNNTISALDTDTTYTAGTGLILNNTIFSTDKTYFDTNYYNKTLADLTFLGLDGGTINGNMIINGNVTIIGGYIDAIVTNQYLNGSFIPSLNNTFDIGSLQEQWNNIYANTLNGNLNCGYITGATSNLCTLIDTNTDTHVAGDNVYLSNDSTTMYFDETKLNATITALDTDTDTRVEGIDYLYNDSTYMYLNETKLNATISILDTDTDTHVSGDNNFLTNDTTTMYFNETKMNNTIIILSELYDNDTNTDTHVGGDNVYLTNDSTTMYFNETKLNNTISALDTDTDTHVSGDNLYLTNDSTTMFFNETRLNNTITALDTNTQWVINETVLRNQSGILGVNKSWFQSIFLEIANFFTKEGDNNYLYNDSTTIYFNETKLNNTISALDTDTDTHVSGDNIYLTNDSTTMYFNETRLNNTISILDTDTDTRVEGINYLFNDSTYMYLNETKLNNTINSLEIDTHVGGDNVYLTNDSTTMFFNETRLNSTINNLDTDTRVEGIDYLFNDSTYMYLNETKLNTTISALDTDTDTHVSGDTNYLTNDSTTMYFNETKLNNTITALDTDTDTRVEGIDYLYNDSTYMYLNGTKLNNTINALEIDTHVGGDNVYLTNDSTTMFFDETKLNATINALEIDTDTHVEGDNLYLTNDSITMFFNESRLNNTIIVLSELYDTDTRVVGIGYLYNDSTYMYLNETLLNTTIEALDTDTTYTAGEGLILNSQVFSTNKTYFNNNYYNQTLADLTFLGLDGGTVNGNMIINGNLTIIGGYIDAIVSNQYLNGSFLPSLNNTFDIGSLQAQWNNIYANTLHGNLDCSYITGSTSNLCTLVDTDTDTHVGGDNIYLTNDSTTMFFDETKLNSTITALDTDTDTHVGGDNIYLTNDSTTMYFDETKLNNTISALDTDTNTQWAINTTVLRNQSDVLGINRTWWDNIYLKINNFFTKKGDNNYLYNDSSIIYFNETKLNNTITALDTDTDTHVGGDNNYLTNDSTTMYFNETKLNLTISTLDTDTDTRVEGIDYLFNDSTYMYLNETKLNNTITALDTDTDTHVGGDNNFLTNDSTTMYFNESKMNLTISVLNVDTRVEGINYLYNDSTYMYLNETKLNSTITALDTDTDTHVSGDNNYLTNDSTTMYFNETKLNNTITTLDTDTDTRVEGIDYLFNDSTYMYLNETKLNATINALEIDTDTHVGGDNIYLTNDSTTMYFNETRLNNTISVLDTDTNTQWLINNTVLRNQSGVLGINRTWWDNLYLKIDNFFTKNSDNNYLYNDSTTIFFNETKLNATINALEIDTDTHVGGDNVYLTNDTTTMYFNESKMNQTIIIISELYDTDTRVVGIGYLYNDSTYMYLNETLLNTTIEALDTDTTYTAGEGLILNSQVFSTNKTYFNNNYYNQTLADLTFLSTNGGTINGNIIMNGNLTIIGGYIDAIVTNQYLNGSFLPSLNNTFDIGSLQAQWNNIYANTLHGNLDCNYITGSSSNLCTLIDTDTDTHVAGDSVYLTNDSTTMYFDESKMNSTIITITDERDTDTHVAGDSVYLTNDSTTMYFNETKLNITIEALNTDTDTQWTINETVLRNQSDVLGINRTWWDNIYLKIENFFTKQGDEKYLYNDSTTIYLNETKLNQTIAALDTDTDTHVSGDENYLTNDSTTMYFNETKMNETIIILSEQYDNDTDIRIQGDGNYLTNDSTTMYFNETKLNKTIDERDTDTKVEGQGYLYNDSTYMYLNETQLNQTIEALDTDTDTHVEGDENYLTNDSTTMYFNETKMNQTIIILSEQYDNDTDTKVQGDGNYLTNDSTTMYFNETKMNNTILILNADTTWPINETVLRNQSGILGINRTWWDNIYLKITDFFTKQGDDKYLYNDTTTIYLNESKLNDTIDNYVTGMGIVNTEKEGGSPYLYNDSTTIYYNESVLNDTIDDRYDIQIGQLSKLFQGVDVLGGLKVTNIPQVINLTYVNIKDDYYSHSITVNPGEVTILEDGWYRVSAMMTVQTIDASQGVRGSPELHINIWNGTDWVEQPENMGGYIRENSVGELSTSITGIGLFEFNANQKIRLTVYDTVANEPNEETVAFSNRLILEYIDRTGNSSGSVDNLKDIGDVDANAPNNGDILVFNGTTSQWVSQLNTLVDTQKDAEGPYLYNDTTTIYLNETQLNTTINNIAQISNFTMTFTVTVSGGMGNAVSSSIADYLITQVTVTPPSTPALYRFELNETTSGEIIDRDRIPHLNIWNVYKSHTLSDSVTAHIKGATVDGAYSVRIKYIDNKVSV